MKRLKRVFDVFRPDQRFVDPSVPITKNASLGTLVGQFNRPGQRVLEIGSREVTGKSMARKLFGKAEYVGFDYCAGPNVDVVGDAHKLETHFSGQRFDLIISMATFEHLAMPWVFNPQIAALLSVGGQALIKAHYSISSHERPWHCLQLSDMALRVLLPPTLGIECIEADASNPIAGYFSSQAAAQLRHRRVPGLYCGSEFLGRKVRATPDTDWTDLDLGAIVDGTRYLDPKPAVVA